MAAIIIYFDTSSLNRLNNDSNKEIIIKALRSSRFQTVISAMNIAELSLTSDKTQRTNLLRMAHKLRKKHLPLAWPEDLLRNDLDRFVGRRMKRKIVLDDKYKGINIGLKHPELIGDIELEEVLNWKDSSI
ncbi:hypothetical protein MNBD_NITROSPINAE04-1288 [hydrothermal vent metagenome]|uniref:PIN domain-containing protein n=1 Tax=hydrothermal vent metagenome TaxID=652676 RepID=A0A3B1D0T3_9ZZZZ